MSARPITDPRRPWQIVLGIGGLVLLLGGGGHPASEEATNVDDSLVEMMADPGWYSAHTLILIGSLVMVAGLALAWRDRIVREQAGVVISAAVVASPLWIVEAATHLFAKVDLDAFQAGDSTPILSTHVFISPFAHLALFLPLAGFAWKLGRHWPMWFRPLAMIGVLGTIVFALAAPVTYWGDGVDFGWMFIGSAPVSLWLISVGVLGTYSTRTPSTSDGAAPATTPVPTATTSGA